MSFVLALVKYFLFGTSSFWHCISIKLYTHLSQSESRNFFMYIVRSENVRCPTVISSSDCLFFPVFNYILILQKLHSVTVFIIWQGWIVQSDWSIWSPNFAVMPSAIPSHGITKFLMPYKTKQNETVKN